MSNNTTCGNDMPCRVLVIRLKSIEDKCDRILLAIEKLSVPDIDQLLLSIKDCAEDMLEQSIRHRKYIENEIGSVSVMHIYRKEEP